MGRVMSWSGEDHEKNPEGLEPGHIQMVCVELLG